MDPQLKSVLEGIRAQSARIAREERQRQEMKRRTSSSGITHGMRTATDPAFPPIGSPSPPVATPGSASGADKFPSTPPRAGSSPLGTIVTAIGQFLWRLIP